jgi:hypothetical protein
VGARRSPDGKRRGFNTGISKFNRLKDLPTRDGKSIFDASSVPYKVAGAAMRQALARAVAANLTPRERKLLDAVLMQTASFSKLADRTSAAQLYGKAHGIPKDSVGGRQRQSALEDLRTMRDLGVILYESGRGPGARLKVGLEPDGTKTEPPRNGVVSIPVPESEKHRETQVPLQRSTTVSGREAPPPGGHDLVTVPRNSSSPRSEEKNAKKDRLAERAFGHFSAKGFTRSECRETVNKLRSENIADELIDVAVGQCIERDARRLAYLLKVGRDFYLQRVGASA